MSYEYGDFGETGVAGNDCPVPAADQPANIFAPTSEAATNAWCDCMYGQSETTSELLTACKGYFPAYPWTIAGKLGRGLPQNLQDWVNAGKDIIPGPVSPVTPPIKPKTGGGSGATGNTWSSNMQGLLVPALLVGAYFIFKK